MKKTREKIRDNPREEAPERDDDRKEHRKKKAPKPRGRGGVTMRETKSPRSLEAEAG